MDISDIKVGGAGVSLYPKIPSPWKRFVAGEKKHQFDTSQWSTPELEFLADVSGWTFTEKLDGTNVRVIWDGYRVDIRGRTDRAQFHPDLLSALEDTFREEILEDAFQDTALTLYGEGIGPKVNGGGKYCFEHTFVLFDVRVGAWLLRREDVDDIAFRLGIPVVPRVPAGDITTAARSVQQGLKSQYGDFFAEGVVGVGPAGLRARDGSRVAVKVKHVDFYGKDYR